MRTADSGRRTADGGRRTADGTIEKIIKYCNNEMKKKKPNFNSKNGRVTEQRTTNVQKSRTVEVV